VKKIWFTEFQEKTLGKIASLPSARTVDTRQIFFNFFLKKPSLPSASPVGTRQRI